MEIDSTKDQVSRRGFLGVGSAALVAVTHTPPELVMAHLNIDRATLDAIPRDESVIVPG